MPPIHARIKPFKATAFRAGELEGRRRNAEAVAGSGKQKATLSPSSDTPMPDSDLDTWRQEHKKKLRRPVVPISMLDNGDKSRELLIGLTQSPIGFHGAPATVIGHDCTSGHMPMGFTRVAHDWSRAPSRSSDALRDPEKPACKKRQATNKASHWYHFGRTRDACGTS